MLEWFYLILVTLIPGIELRGSIPLGILLGMDPVMVFLVCTLVNIASIIPAMIFLDLTWKFFSKYKWFQKFLKSEKKLGAKSFWGMVAFVAIPLPGTGAYTGALLTKLFHLNKKMSFVAIALGVAVAGLVVSLISLGLLEFLKWML